MTVSTYALTAEGLMSQAMDRIRAAARPIQLAFDSGAAAPNIDHASCRRHLSDAIARLTAALALLGDDGAADDGKAVDLPMTTTEPSQSLGPARPTRGWPDHRSDFDTPRAKDSALSMTWLDLDELFPASHSHRNHKINAATTNPDELFR